MGVLSRTTEWQVMKRKGGTYSAVEVPIGFDPERDKYEPTVNNEPSGMTGKEAQAFVEQRNAEALAVVAASILETENE